MDLSYIYDFNPAHKLLSQTVQLINKLTYSGSW